MASNSEPQARPLVIVVDDDAAVRNSLKFLLEIEGLRVRLLSGGKALLADRDLDDCSCLVVDQTMPDMKGIDAILELRHRGIATPVVLLGDKPDGRARQRAAELGAAVEEKPLIGSKLVEVIMMAIRQGRRPG